MRQETINKIIMVLDIKSNNERSINLLLDFIDSMDAIQNAINSGNNQMLKISLGCCRKATFALIRTTPEYVKYLLADLYDDAEAVISCSILDKNKAGAKTALHLFNKHAERVTKLASEYEDILKIFADVCAHIAHIR